VEHRSETDVVADLEVVDVPVPVSRRTEEVLVDAIGPMGFPFVFGLACAFAPPSRTVPAATVSRCTPNPCSALKVKSP